ncbi:MAG: hypothetical protein BWY84_00164 [Candidatus Aerophobetes bacterium ADurb.Bin490]|nr:MAG: hypothetical protein BWY84_00164 [Candidatus Aerophobetes bacterium ADurb.Bin490]
MKKNLFIVFAMVIGFAFAGCSTSPVKDDASSTVVPYVKTVFNTNLRWFPS